MADRVSNKGMPEGMTIYQWDSKTIFAVNIGMCYESNPCRHYAFIDGSVIRFVSAPRLAEMFVERGLQVPDHFKQYIQ